MFAQDGGWGQVPVCVCEFGVRGKGLGRALSSLEELLPVCPPLLAYFIETYISYYSMSPLGISRS